MEYYNLEKNSFSDSERELVLRDIWYGFRLILTDGCDLPWNLLNLNYYMFLSAVDPDKYSQHGFENAKYIRTGCLILILYIALDEFDNCGSPADNFSWTSCSNAVRGMLIDNIEEEKLREYVSLAIDLVLEKEKGNYPQEQLSLIDCDWVKETFVKPAILEIIAE